MKAQRWIAGNVLNNVSVHQCSYAFKPGGSILKCASRHTGARWLIKLDISGFFGSITEIRVYNVFRSLGYQPLVSFELARLTTHAPTASERYKSATWLAKDYSGTIFSYKRKHIGYLPQGAPTSPMLSNLVMWPIDSEILRTATKFGLVYTRYADDITFSTRGHFDRDNAVAVIREVACKLRKIGLALNEKKTRVVPPGGRKIVLGLLVDGSLPRLSVSFRSNLRQHLYYLEKVGPFKHAAARGFDTIGGLYRHIRGLIDFARMIDPEYADVILARFDAVRWPRG
jgi:RNA-directed DNA polymerase